MSIFIIIIRENDDNNELLLLKKNYYIKWMILGADRHTLRHDLIVATSEYFKIMDYIKNM